MKLWINFRTMLNYPNFKRVIFSHTLRTKHTNSFSKSNPHLSRRKYRLINSYTSCKRSINILRLYVPSYRTRDLLWILFSYRNLKYRSSNLFTYYSLCFPRLCFTLRANIFLRSYSDYKSSFSHSIFRTNFSLLNLRRIFSR